MADVLGVDMQWHPEDWFYGVDGEYHPPGFAYRPGWSEDGSRYIYYRAESHPWKIEGVTPPSSSPWGPPGSFLGIDGKRHPSGWYYGADGEYHHPDTRYDIITGRYTDPPKR